MNFTFDNRFINNLPADEDQSNQTRHVEGAAFSFVEPTKTGLPRLVSYSSELAESLGLTENDINSLEFSRVFSGNQLLDGMQPYAMCYGGHQFGHWAGQLGDGRAINLAEIVLADYSHKTLQLKGAGPTPYSRTADGLAVLRSSVREFLCSEAMYHLGIPTTRALSLCLTGDKVVRDMFYDGNAKAEDGAVVCRVSSSFMRFGTFQLPASRNDINLLTKLVNHSVLRDFSHLLDSSTKESLNNNIADKLSPQIYLNWLSEISDRTCALMVDWLRVGFVHGVMNTDNMSIIGETIDYGPYGWIDAFDPTWTPNTTDAQGKRYCFGEQAQISQWNLFQLANAIYPLIEDAKPLQQLLEDYATSYQDQWLDMMRGKLGLVSKSENDQQLMIDLENLLMSVETDMTLFYRQLAQLSTDETAIDKTLTDKTPTTELCPIIENQQQLTNDVAIFKSCYYQPEQLTVDYQKKLSTWLNKYRARVQGEASKQNKLAITRSERMNSVNPIYVLRNYLAQQAIEAAEQGDFSKIHQLQQVLKNPYTEQEKYNLYAQKRPEWARNKAGCSMLSCSS